MSINWQVTKVKINDLKDYDKNARKISKDALEKLATHIKQDGYHQRIICNTDFTIIGGHQRKKALIMAGFDKEDFIECLIPDKELSIDEIDRLNIRDNISFGEYDFDLLKANFTLPSLKEYGLDSDLIRALQKDEDKNLLEQEDAEVEALSLEPNAKLGDIYVLGNNRLMCGDSTNPQHVAALLNGANPILMVTDPPYGVNYKPEWREQLPKGTLNTDKVTTGKVLNDDRYDWSDTYSLFTGDVAYVWHSTKHTHKFAENLENCGFDLLNLVIWKKQHLVLSRGDYHYQHEPLWYAVRKGKKHNWQGQRDQSTVWDIDNNNYGAKTKEEQTGHGTQKPIECMLRPILNNSAQGESVYDPFGGSGTTLIACERSKRNCYMMELSPAYVDVIIKRWEKETGQKAILEANE
jgi:site-specific DNA-methyltransferase (adenine-specific)